jgi:hypothetical protein
MKILFKEDKLAREQIELTIALDELNPMMSQFRVSLTKDKDGVLGLAIDKYGIADLAPGHLCKNTLVIWHGSGSKPEIALIKALFKKELKPLLQKYGYFDGLSEERIK